MDIPGGPKTPNPEDHTNAAGTERHLGEGSGSPSRRRKSLAQALTTQVCVRVRPILQYEQEEGQGSIWRCERDKVIRKGSPGITYFHGPNVRFFSWLGLWGGFWDSKNLLLPFIYLLLPFLEKPLHFRMHRVSASLVLVFGPEATNDRIFKRCVVSCLDTLCQGKSCTVMAYGEDTSGKSHSLMGSEEENGVIWYGTLAMRVLTCKDEPRLHLQGSAKGPRRSRHLFVLLRDLQRGKGPEARALSLGKSADKSSDALHRSSATCCPSTVYRFQSSTTQQLKRQQSPAHASSLQSHLTLGWEDD
eukprot:3730815-Rhodomonas_salina.3